MAPVRFGYTDNSEGSHSVTTLEEDEYPAHYHQGAQAPDTTRRSCCGHRRVG